MACNTQDIQLGCCGTRIVLMVSYVKSWNDVPFDSLYRGDWDTAVIDLPAKLGQLDMQEKARQLIEGSLPENSILFYERRFGPLQTITNDAYLASGGGTFSNSINISTNLSFVRSGPFPNRWSGQISASIVYFGAQHGLTCIKTQEIETGQETVLRYEMENPFLGSGNTIGPMAFRNTELQLTSRYDLLLSKNYWPVELLDFAPLPIDHECNFAP